MSERFKLTTKWRFDAPVEAVWSRLTDAHTFPEWWPGFERVEVDGDGGVGTIARYLVKGDYGMRFDLVTVVEVLDEPRRIQLRSSGGLVGTGLWTLREDGEATYVTYVWDVEPSNPLLRLLSRVPALRRRMERSHDRVMEAGGKNLARLLAAGPIPSEPVESSSA